ncbi:hypothetical protein BDY21DRAFT_77777 [Lineolata rhizophorae]|uniref:Uncharacterized protein n=1 Tax=Lineolata rhizophorae TaxID=578093 RepID=A0A6A6NUE3_9PEZI|nr:hypothetical protein BDY21DRAFT_77777 [Lineolata rhizophorae]
MVDISSTSQSATLVCGLDDHDKPPRCFASGWLSAKTCILEHRVSSFRTEFRWTAIPGTSAYVRSSKLSKVCDSRCSKTGYNSMSGTLLLASCSLTTVSFISRSRTYILGLRSQRALIYSNPEMHTIALFASLKARPQTCGFVGNPKCSAQKTDSKTWNFVRGCIVVWLYMLRYAGWLGLEALLRVRAGLKSRKKKGKKGK